MPSCPRSVPAHRATRGGGGRLRDVRVVLGALIVAVGACGILEPEVSESGVVTYRDIEGGCWVIETDDETYLPLNLPNNLRVNGLHVLFEGNRRLDVPSPCPGTPLDLVFIESVVDGGGQ